MFLQGLVVIFLMLLSDVEIARLAGAVEMLTSVGASIQTINAATTEHVGYENAVALPKLATLVSDMTGFLRAALVRRDPSLAQPPGRQPEHVCPVRNHL